MDQDLLHSRDRPESKASACPVFRGFQSKVEGAGQRQLINKSVNEEDNFREQIIDAIIKAGCYDREELESRGCQRRLLWAFAFER